MINSLNKVISIYTANSFKIWKALMDREFDCLVPNFPGININKTATRKHILDIERRDCVIKERALSIHIKLPYKHIPKRMIIDLPKFEVTWLTIFPVNSGLSDTLKPRNIMTGTTLDWKKHCKAKFGAYREVHEVH